MKILGIDDSITVCDCCGKKNLKCTVALETEGGDIVHYGRDCAGYAAYGSKSRKNGDLAELRARARHRVEPVISAIRAALPSGLDAAKSAGKAATKDGWIYWNDRVRGEYHDVRCGRMGGLQVSVMGYESWGCIMIHWSGGEERISLA